MVKKIISSLALFLIPSICHAVSIPYEGSTHIQDVRVISVSTTASSFVAILTSTNNIAYTNVSNVFTSSNVFSSTVSIASLIAGGTTYTAPTIYNLGTTGGAITINWNTAKNQYITINANSTFTFTGGGVSGERYRLMVKQDATGNRTINWGSSVRFSNGGVNPLPSTTAGSLDSFGFFYNNVDSKFDNDAIILGY